MPDIDSQKIRVELYTLVLQIQAKIETLKKQELDQEATALIAMLERHIDRSMKILETF